MENKFINPKFSKNYKGTFALTGAYAVAEAMRQIEPDVVAAYPITPQTPIVEKFSQYVADGKVSTEMVLVESEHSAMSAVVGASSAGARAMTATSSVGLALMFEVVNAASGLRLPIVMPVVNRALSAPINIHCDHSDTMACRDAGWIQLYSESAQEAYENTLLALRLSEHPDVMLPSMVCQDGFITSHSVEVVNILNDDAVKHFVGEYNPKDSLLLSKNPITVGALQLTDSFFETKRQQVQGMENFFKVYPKIAEELSSLTGNEYPFVEPYALEDAQCAIVALNSSAGTIRFVVKRLREKGLKVGMLKIKLFRPFPYEDVAKALSHVPKVAVLDRSLSFGANAPLFSEIKNCVPKNQLFSYVYGLGGRELLESHVEELFKNLLSNKEIIGQNYLGLKE